MFPRALRTILLSTGLLATALPTRGGQALYPSFQNPGPAYRGKPFWSWNGELEEGELLRQIEVLREMGMGGFFMHSRTGLATEYLGPEWMRLINTCADAGARLGLEAWLYDEDRWPSGTAGGLVTRNPAYRMRFLRLQTVPAAQFGWRPGIVAAFACDLDGLSFTHCRRITNETPSSAFPRQTILVFTIEEFAKSSFYNGYSMVDTMNRQATEDFIRRTHERYSQACGPRLGTSIRGIFTDEPHRGCVMGHFGMNNPDPGWLTPWTEGLPAAYRQRFGADLMALLPDLFLQRDGRRVHPVKWRYLELCQELFLANWAAPLSRWCEDHGLQFTGHALHEDSLTAQTSMQGSLMRFYEVQHIPGVDCLTEGNRNYWVVKQCSSVARQLGRPWVLSELYGVTGWQFDFEGHKAVGDWQALFGVNLRCHHLSWYTMAGQAKRDYPASILHQSAWYPDYAPVETYFARLGLLLQQGRPQCDLLVINPVESVWCQIHADWAQTIATPRDPEVRALEQAHRDLFAWLAGSQIDFDYADEDMLGRLGRLETKDPAGPVLRLGQAPYRAVLVPPLTTLRASTLAALSGFAQAGGTVLFAGAPPAYVDARPDERPAHLAAAPETQTCPWERDAVVTTLRRHLPPQPRLADAASGASLPEVFCQLRRDGQRSVFVVMNMNRQQPQPAVRIDLPVRGEVTEWDGLTGARYRVPATPEGDGLRFVTDLPPVGSRLFVIEPQVPDLPARPQQEAVRRLLCPGPYAYSLDEENVCVLDRARYRSGDGPWQGPIDILKIDQALRRDHGLALRGGHMVQPWYARRYLPPPASLGPVELAFTFEVATRPPDPVTLVLEGAAHTTVRLNDRPVDASVHGRWVDRALERLDLPAGALRLGRNTVTLRLDFRADRDLEAVYLLGRFGVRVDGTDVTLTRLPGRLRAGDVTGQGLPFYSGRIRYHLNLPRLADPAASLVLACPDFEGACVKVLAPGRPAQLLPWPPYEADVTAAARAGKAIDLEVVLTRRNTFGPLHLVPKRSGAYGPDHWTTEGKQWSDAYQLWEAGLLAAPSLQVRRATP